MTNLLTIPIWQFKKSMPWPEPSGELRQTLKAVRADQRLCVLEGISFLQ